MLAVSREHMTVADPYSPRFVCGTVQWYDANTKTLLDSTYLGDNPIKVTPRRPSCADELTVEFMYPEPYLQELAQKALSRIDEWPADATHAMLSLVPGDFLVEVRPNREIGRASTEVQYHYFNGKHRITSPLLEAK